MAYMADNTDKTQIQDDRLLISPCSSPKEFTSDLSLGDNLSLIKNLVDNSIDGVISDIPYRIDFMARNWDKFTDFKPLWKECLRVLKPGGFAFLMSDVREDVSSILITELHDVGFETDFDSIEWTYLSGFPKAQNFYKALDRQAFNLWLKERHPWWNILFKKCIEGLKDLSKEDRMELLGDLIRLKHEWKTIWANVEFGIHLKARKYEHWGRQGRSYQTDSDIFSQSRSEDVVSDEYSELIESLTIDPPITPFAQAVDGMYSAELKPARELIIVVRKPLEFSSNLEHTKKWKNGGLYMDHARIPADDEQLLKNNAKGHCGSGGTGILGWNNGDQISCKESEKPPISKADQLKILKKRVGGRLQNPITFGQVEATGFKIRMPSHRGGPIHPDPTGQHNNSGWNDPDGVYVGENSFTELDLRGRFPATLLVSDNALDGAPPKKGKEGFSDYFSLDKWWTNQIKHFPLKVQKTFPFLYVPKPSKKEKNAGLSHYSPTKITDGRNAVVDVPFQRGEAERLNTHTTVKPIQLMCYIIALSPTKVGDVILDPFMGSGTTGISCHLTGRRFIGYEIEPESFTIAQARIAHAKKKRNLLAFALF
jgi:DNA modification methylase